MKRGFTLIELLVVIAIIGLLGTLSVVSFSSSREKARLAKGSAFSGQVLRNYGDDIALRWDFEECNGGTTADQSETMTIGTLTNGPTWTTNTPSGKGCAISFDGADDYIASSAGIDLANRSFTVSAWASRRVPGVYHNIVSIGAVTGINQMLHFGFRSGDTFMCDFYGNNLDTVTTFTDSKWHHFICTYDAITRERRIYVDGSLSRTATAPSNFIGTSLVAVGRANHGAYQFNGLLDDIRIYKRAMTSREVQQLYAENSPLYLTQE